MYLLLSLPPSYHTLHHPLCWARAGTTLVSGDADPAHCGMFTVMLSQNALLTGLGHILQGVFWPSEASHTKTDEERMGEGGGWRWLLTAAHKVSFRYFHGNAD